MVPKTINTEIWLPVPNFSGYEVSSFGRVRSVNRQIVCRNGVVKSRMGVTLRPGVSEGYPSVSVRRDSDGKRTAVKVHILVAAAFIGPRPLGAYVCHNSKNRSDASLGNLRYDTPKNNQSDRNKDGTKTNGEKHPMSKLTSSEVNEILTRLKSGQRQQSVADEYGVSQATVSMIKNGLRWAQNGEDSKNYH